MATKKPKATLADKTTPEAGSAPALIPAEFVRRERPEETGDGLFRHPRRILRFRATPSDPLPELWIEVRAFAYRAELTALMSRTYFADILASAAGASLMVTRTVRWPVWLGGRSDAMIANGPACCCSTIIVQRSPHVVSPKPDGGSPRLGQ